MTLNKNFSEKTKQNLNKTLKRFYSNSKNAFIYTTFENKEEEELALITLKNMQGIYFFIDNNKLGITNDPQYKTVNEKPFKLFYKENEILNYITNIYKSNNSEKANVINPIKINVNKINKICNYETFLYILEINNYNNRNFDKNHILIFHNNTKNKTIGKIIDCDLNHFGIISEWE